MDSKLIQLNHAIKQSGKRKITRDDIKQQAKRKGLWGRGRERQMNRERERQTVREDVWILGLLMREGSRDRSCDSMKTG